MLFKHARAQELKPFVSETVVRPVGFGLISPKSASQLSEASGRLQNENNIRSSLKAVKNAASKQTKSQKKNPLQRKC